MLSVATREIGLRMHMGKTRILSNVPDSSRTGVDHIVVDGNEVKILGYSETVNYLGAVLTCDGWEDAEIKHRTNKGWAKFA
eukprot:305161-Karenia_brevis.AAC.1